jgi:hypothetical protein
VPNPDRSSRPEDPSSDPGAVVGRSPILVTGVHRSGTNWMASSLRARGEVIYISEPLDILQSPSFFEFPLENWNTYINEANEGLFLESYRSAFRFHLETGREIRKLRSVEASVRLGKRSLKYLVGRLQSRRPLVRDAFAVFSGPWFARRLGCRVVVIVRHPAALVSSLKRLGWTFDFRHLLRQPALMDDRLAEFRGEREAALRAPTMSSVKQAFFGGSSTETLTTIEHSPAFTSFVTRISRSIPCRNTRASTTRWACPSPTTRRGQSPA